MRELPGDAEVMTSLWKRIGLGLIVLATAGVTASAAPQAGTATNARLPVAMARTATAPQYIRDRINDLGRGFDGRVGIAVRSIDEGWSAG